MTLKGQQVQSGRDIARGLALFATLLAACEGAPARSKPWRHHREPAVEGARSPVLEAEAERVRARRERAHALRIHLDRDPLRLAPLVHPTEWTLRITMGTVFEPLVRYRPPAGGAGPGRYLPGLARGWKVGPGGREIRLELRPDVHFHDGRTMTSVDVQFSLDAARGSRTGADLLRAELADVSSVDIVGPRSIRVRLARPNAYVLRALAEIPILPAHVYKDRLGSRGAGGPLVGTGPYRLVSTGDDSIRLRRYQGYWGEAPAIEEVVFVRENDAARALTAAKEGELDLLPALIAAHYPEQASAPGIATEFSPLRLRPPVFRYVALNVRRPPLDDARVRLAIAHLVDQAGLCKRAHHGFARPVAGPIWPGGPGNGVAPPPVSLDPERAAALLDAAGWKDGDGDGVREWQGQGRRLMLTALVTGEDNAERDEVLDALGRSGIVIDRRVGPPAVLENRLRQGTFDIAFLEWRGAVDRDLSPLLASGGANNYGGFSDPRVDRVLAALERAWTPAARGPLQAELAGLLSETQPVIALPAPDPYGLLHRRVRGAAVWNGWLSIPALSLAPAGDE